MKNNKISLFVASLDESFGVIFPLGKGSVSDGGMSFVKKNR